MRARVARVQTVKPTAPTIKVKPLSVKERQERSVETHAAIARQAKKAGEDSLQAMVKKVSGEDFKTATRAALLICPRTEKAEICGYSGVDSKGKKYDTCLLPSGHDGPHMSVEPSEIPRSVPRKVVHTAGVLLETSSYVDDILTDILYAWRKTGNPWSSGLEMELSVYSKGIQFENKIANVPALQALHFLGYFDRQQEHGESVVRYRLSKKGLRATAEIAKKVGDTKPDEIVLSDDCQECGGSGMDDDNEECTACSGTGISQSDKPKQLAPTRRTGKVTPKARVVSSSQRSGAVKPKLVECERCNGDGVGEDGDECSVCNGNGETTPQFNQTWRNHVAIMSIPVKTDMQRLTRSRRARVAPISKGRK